MKLVLASDQFRRSVSYPSFDLSRFRSFVYDVITYFLRMKQGTLLSNVKTYVIGGLVMSCFPALMLSLQILFRVKVNAAYPTTDFPKSTQVGVPLP